MAVYLRQATASQSRAIGPFVDDTDFKTAETALTIANTDIRLIMNGGASTTKNSGGGTHRINGVYGVTFDATDTATVGELFVSVVISGALPVFHTFVVIEEAVYDALFAAAAPGFGSVAQLTTIQAKTDTIPASPAAVGSAMALAPGAITEAAIVTAAAEKIADILLRRHTSNIEASSLGDSLSIDSVYGLLALATGHKRDTTTHAGQLTVFKSDGSTELAQIPITTDATAEPIVSAGS